MSEPKSGPMEIVALKGVVIRKLRRSYRGDTAVRKLGGRGL